MAFLKLRFSKGSAASASNALGSTFPQESYGEKNLQIGSHFVKHYDKTSSILFFSDSQCIMKFSSIQCPVQCGSQSTVIWCS